MYTMNYKNSVRKYKEFLNILLTNWNAIVSQHASSHCCPVYILRSAQPSSVSFYFPHGKLHFPHGTTGYNSTVGQLFSGLVHVNLSGPQDCVSGAVLVYDKNPTEAVSSHLWKIIKNYGGS